MMEGRLLDHDPITGISEFFHYDAQTDSAQIEYRQDVSKILEWNKERRVSAGKAKLQSKRDLLHYARVPVIAQYDMLFRHGVRFGDREHRKKVMALLNTSEYEYCR